MGRYDEASSVFRLPTINYEILRTEGALAYFAEIPDKSSFQPESLLRMDEVVKQITIPTDRVQTHAIYGYSRYQILKLVDAIDAYLIIITSNRPDITTYLLGWADAAVVRHTKCPFLVVR